MAGFTRILVPTDFSETADAALTYAKEIAERFGASIRLVHVFDDPFVNSVFSPDVYAPVPQTLREAVLRDVRSRLAERLTSAEKARFGGDADILTGVTVNAIIDDANVHHVDLIVMGTHGRRGISHAVLGSVAERVVRTAPCPVLTVRHPKLARVEVPELATLSAQTA
jgi:nucleotide-binding universal stress UspA family protein